ncbi:Protein of unknown function [Cotesia congregata]|uniref:Peptidase S1 domain-containing protein n=1 Tax=Cotesia congregata TaxID=51543 RepID=A0A8J2MUP0_COTCN|nr:Protein of unknown function [Cotesia congregata]
MFILKENNREKVNPFCVPLVIVIMIMINGINVTITQTVDSIPHRELIGETPATEDTPTTEVVTDNTTVENQTDKPIVINYWMMKMGDIKEDLLGIQAVVVKDEDAEAACSEGKMRSRRRFLMCAGSILHRNRILTTASCLHEAMHIKHNIRAPLAVVIAPLKTSVQVIRVAEYKIHPEHNTNPYSPDHTKHNIAILSLACRISTVNYNKIYLPTEPMTHICTEENCVLAVYTKTRHELVIHQIQAPQIPINYRKRRSINENKFINPNHTGLIDVKSNVKKLVKRSSDGTSGCAQTGAAVMVNRNQTAIVAISCDDRQKDGKWYYTDLFYNTNWIRDVLNDWNKPHENKQSVPNGITGAPTANDNATNPRGCGNCIFNFYISVGCKEKGNCPKGSRVMTNGPTASHNVRQVTNREFTDNWSHANQDPNRWSKQAITNDNIQQTLQPPVAKCRDNSPECLNSAGNQDVFKPQSIFRNGDIPMIVRAQNQSIINRYGQYHPAYDGLRRFGNHPWIVRKVKKNQKQALFALRNSANKKYIKGEMGNGLRRRHVSSSGKTNEQIRNRKHAKS